MGRTNDAAGTFKQRTSTSKAAPQEDPNKHPVTGVLSGLARMEDQNHLPEHLDDPPPRRNDHGAAGQDDEQVAVHKGAHEPDHMDPLIDGRGSSNFDYQASRERQQQPSRPSLSMDKEAIESSRFDELMEMMSTAVKCLQECTSSSSEEDDDFYGREEDVNYMGARRGYQGRVFNQSFRNRGRNTKQCESELALHS
ncbi:hypothetical protein ISN45_Aa05g006850 [Arabidopsis thaliana x Arabidopsis arenosa]|uniref:Uncharacterized protein n=1 Tax=Arabidopsis thaliana x Arabidopsis arenosa TaxID=1240361 RepID=A0A8T1ZI04_9BRAS|nr:hypothetical protein ISN45_Aa05g006850 [Arabidopsis thaliana x Arabidopsis arenosa]